MIPPAAILVEGDDDEHLLPLRALLQRVDHSGDMAIAGVDIRIAGVHVEIALRLVEGNRRQRARLDIGEEFVGPRRLTQAAVAQVPGARRGAGGELDEIVERLRSEEHTSELQSLMRISYAVFCLKKKK